MKRFTLLLTLLALPLAAAAQYPNKPIRAIVAFGTGGATDVIARIVAASMSQSLGQPIVIDNRPGVMDQFHHGQDVFFDVAKEIGLRVVGAPFIMSASNARLGEDGYPVWDFEHDGLSELQRSIETFTARDEGTEGLVQVAIGPHATDTCLPELLRECRRAADNLGCVLTTHFAQTEHEVALLRSRYGKGPAEYARDSGLLGPNVTLAHAGCATDDELKLLASTGTHVANCAFSFVREGVSFPYARFARAGINTGIGTDSHGMDIVAEMRITGLLSKHFYGKAHVGTAHELFHAETLAGANALGRHAKVDEAAIMRTAATAASKIWAVGAERGILPRK